ncbi:MFS transporter [Sphingomonas sp.]|uniref:MFS transporter n=1 Tax=Sphingomonas sp. TaxID=28214 RepID=UPI0025D9D454|nr:MFS transporter [Sphingomonas sp.]
MTAGTSSGGREEKVAAILAAFIGLAAGYPSSYGATATTFILPLTQEFGWTRFVPALMYFCSMSGIALSSIWLGRVIERFGSAAVAASSGLCLAMVLVALGSQTGSIALALVTSFLAGALGAGTSVGLYLSALPRWFDRDLGRALGISIVGMSVGVTLMPALAALVSNTSGWRTAYYTLAAVQLGLTLCASLVLFWLSRRNSVVAGAKSNEDQTGIPLSQALQTRSFWRLSAIVLLATLGVFGPSFQLFPLYSDRGVAPSLLPIVAIALGIGTLLGRLCSGVLLDYVDARFVAFGTFALAAVGVIWLSIFDHAHSIAALCIPPLLIGSALGAESDIVAYLVRRFYGLRDHAAIYNRVLVAYYLGAVAGPLGLGWAFNHLANVNVALMIVAASSIAACALVVTLPSPGIRVPVEPLDFQ